MPEYLSPGVYIEELTPADRIPLPDETTESGWAVRGRYWHACGGSDCWTAGRFRERPAGTRGW
jgi:hypothetical protein